MHNYLKAKLRIETADFSKEKISTMLTDKTVSDEYIAQFIELLTSCEQARYSPTTEVQIQADYDKAKSVIANLDKQL